VPLRELSELGLTDATAVAPRDAAPSSATTTAGRSSPPAGKRRRGGSSPPPTAPQANGESPLALASVPRADVPLADEPTKFVQIFVPGELQERLADASHALAADHDELRHQKTILGALVWRYVRPDDPDALRELGAALDSFLQTDLSKAPAEIKIGGHLPFSLKYNLEGASLRLRRTRRQASAKTLLSALICRYVDPADLSELVQLLRAYHEASRPTPALL
jgi:hypothetical protein